MTPRFQGPLAALLAPRDEAGAADIGALERNIEFVIERGLTGVVTTGGTGEYFDLSLDERRKILDAAKAAAAGRVAVIASNGAARLDDVVELGRHALEHGADALLLPPPHFYRYAQADLTAFYEAAAKRIDGPILIYNLAAFVTPIEPETTVHLIESTANIIGVKDSSGRLDTLAALTARPDLQAVRILGNDRVLAKALEDELLDAVISGPAGVVPEAAVALFAAQQTGERTSFRAVAKLFGEMVEQVDAFPYPWSLQALAEHRGLFPASYPFPPGAERLEQAEELSAWFDDWLARLTDATGRTLK